MASRMAHNHKFPFESRIRNKFCIKINISLK
nr:MAG TPA: hypothetical protein [Caudoviricetes sp.]